MILWEGLVSGLQSVWTLARVVIPLMIFLEIAKANHWLEKVNHWIYHPFKQIGLSEYGAFPVLVAMIFGLTFGSGVIIANIQEGKLSSKEVKIIGAFIAICHALIEDTLLFMALGVPFWILVFPRLLMAVITSLLLHKFYLQRQEKVTAIAK